MYAKQRTASETLRITSYADADFAGRSDEEARQRWSSDERQALLENLDCDAKQSVSVARGSRVQRVGEVRMRALGAAERGGRPGHKRRA